MIQGGSEVFPIEVKGGTTGSLKSLRQFLEDKNPPFGIRISHHLLSFHDKILSVPLYLMSQLKRLMQENLFSA